MDRESDRSSHFYPPRLLVRIVGRSNRNAPNHNHSSLDSTGCAEHQVTMIKIQKNIETSAMRKICRTLLLAIMLLPSVVLSQTDFESTKARAEAGDAEAQYSLGLKYYIPSGVAQNYPEANRWFSLAAEQDHGAAQLMLALMYESGKGVVQNEGTALALYQLVEKKGIPAGAIGRMRLQTMLAFSSQQQEAQMLSYEEKCVSFGFKSDTPEMANCKFELYKLENTASAAVGAAPSPSPSSSELDSLQLLNQSLQMMKNSLNGIRPTAPVQTSVSCTRIGDFSRQVFTFNGIACPAGYAPSF